MDSTPKNASNTDSHSKKGASQVVDGRRKRSQRSREKIIAAMFRLIKDDDPSPSVVAIAKEAGVGLRTAFRHFSDLNSLIVEMSQQLKDELHPIAFAPYESTTWRGKVTELIDRRAIVFERTMLVKVSADIKRFRSEFLMNDYNMFLERERASLLEVLPKKVTRNKAVTASLLMALSFQSWTQLRLQQRLSPKDARNVMHTTTKALLGE